MRCSNCGSENPAGKKFCGDCGAPLANRCPNCGSENPAGQRFCGECGSALRGHTQPGATQSPRAESNAPDIRIASGQTDASLVIEGERKTVTALFADIKGSMELMEDLDPEEARTIIDPALKLMIEAVRRYGGYVVQSTGDGIFALFGAPIAHEDHPQRALYAALRLQEEMRRYSGQLREAGNLPVEARVGVNTGDVVVRSIATGENRPEYTPIGHSTSLAARMQALAPTGSIAVTDGTRKLCEGYFTFRTLGPARVKGVSEPVEVFEVIGLGPLRTRLQVAARRGLTKFVGREREMEALRHAAAMAKDGRGQLVAVMAEPGVGKSRLFYEFKMRSQSGWMVLEALSVSHGKAPPYLPVIELLHGYFSIDANDDGRKRREKVNGRIVTLDPALEDTRPYLFALLGLVESDDPLAQMDAQIRRRRTQDAIMRILLRESLNQPLMLIFEDLHWIDEETQAFLNLLAEGVANAPVLILVNYRPEYTHPWAARPNYTQLHLDPLGKESAGEMLSALVGDSAELAPLKRLVLERTEGNPLFMEELIQALLDEGVLVRNGAVKVTKSLGQLKIPPTVQGILASRIDRLPPEQKDLLQTLAVIGTEFPLALVHMVVRFPPERLESLLDDLQTADFIYEQPAPTDIEYIFKHVLTHDVAYSSLLIKRRRFLHERIAKAIEALFRERLEDHFADLAHHYRLSTNTAKAIEYLCLAGEQAARQGAYAQAVANVEPALTLVERLPEGPERLRAELGARLMQGMCVAALSGFGSKERLQTFQQVCELSDRLADASALIRGLLNVAGAYASGGEISRALGSSRRCVELAKRSNNPKTLWAALLQLATCTRVSGDLVQTSLLCDELIKSIGSPVHGVVPELLPANLWIDTLVNFALAQQMLGHPDEALKLSDEAVWRARQLKHRFSLALALLAPAALRFYRREPEAAYAAAEALITLAEEQGFGEMMAFGRSLRGWAIGELGQVEKGIAELEASAALLPAGLWMMLSGMLAQVHIDAGRSVRALEILDETLARIEWSGTHVDEPELRRLKGEVILKCDSSAIAEAETWYREATAMARKRSAKWWELRATVSLARLLRDTNRRGEARTMLAEIYNWFTEGFELPDLKEAKALLEEIGGSLQ